MANACRKISYLRILAFLLIPHLIYAQQTVKPTTPLKGAVQTFGGHKPVAFTEMGIQGIDSADTSAQGEFTLGIPDQAKPLHVVVTFYVKNWKVIQPSLNGRLGDTFMPPPNAGDVIVLVALPGQREIWLTDASIETMLLGATYHFKKVISLEQETLLSPNHLSLAVSAHVGTPASLSDEEVVARKYFDDWLDKTAKEIDISRTDIEIAISSWIERARNDFDRGLGLLYQGNITSAIAALEAARRTKNQKKELYIATHQALAFGYVLQRNYPAAEEVLRKAFAETGDSDQNFLNHLGNVFIIDRKPDEAKRAFEKASGMLRSNGIASSLTPKSTPTPTATPNRGDNPASLLPSNIPIRNKPLTFIAQRGWESKASDYANDNEHKYKAEAVSDSGWLGRGHSEDSLASASADALRQCKHYVQVNNAHDPETCAIIMVNNEKIGRW